MNGVNQTQRIVMKVICPCRALRKPLVLRFRGRLALGKVTPAIIKVHANFTKWSGRNPWSGSVLVRSFSCCGSVFNSIYLNLSINSNSIGLRLICFVPWEIINRECTEFVVAMTRTEHGSTFRERIELEYRSTSKISSTSPCKICMNFDDGWGEFSED